MDEWMLACRVLLGANVPYLVVGAFGAELLCFREVRAILTHDMDLLLSHDREALARALTALQGAGFELWVGDEPLVWDEVILDGVIRAQATVRATRNEQSVDLMLSGVGLDFAELWPQGQEYPVQGVPLRIAPLEAILRSKKLANRIKDRLFLEQFREVIEEALEFERKRAEREGRRPRGSEPSGPAGAG